MATKETELTKFDNGENYESVHEGENVDEHTCLPLVTFKGNNNYNIYHEYYTMTCLYNTSIYYSTAY